MKMAKCIFLLDAMAFDAQYDIRALFSPTDRGQPACRLLSCLNLTVFRGTYGVVSKVRSRRDGLLYVLKKVRGREETRMERTRERGKSEKI